MDWSKVDAALAGALAGEAAAMPGPAPGDAGSGAGDGGADRPGAERRYPVFVQLDAAAAEEWLLAELEVSGPHDSATRTASLNRAGVARLTDQPWVTKVQLSGPLRLRGDH